MKKILLLTVIVSAIYMTTTIPVHAIYPQQPTVLIQKVSVPLATVDTDISRPPNAFDNNSKPIPENACKSTDLTCKVCQPVLNSCQEQCSSFYSQSIDIAFCLLGCQISFKACYSTGPITSSPETLP